MLSNPNPTVSRARHPHGPAQRLNGKSENRRARPRSGRILLVSPDSNRKEKAQGKSARKKRKEKAQGKSARK